MFFIEFKEPISPMDCIREDAKNYKEEGTLDAFVAEGSTGYSNYEVE